jgi:hypothetical protein
MSTDTDRNHIEWGRRDIWHAREVRRDAHRFLVCEPENKEPLRRPRRRWEDNNKMDPQDVELRGGGTWTGLIWLTIRTNGGLF